MSQEYNHSYMLVNNFSCFTRNKLSCIKLNMNYGERLKISREFANITQKQLAEASGVSQANISKLEIGDATGSEFTVQFAITCGVRPEWLALGTGEMSDGLYVHNDDIKRAVLLMQEMPEYAVKEAVKSIDGMAQFIKMAETANQKK